MAYVRDTFAKNGISAEDFGSHSFRRRGATFAYTAGASGSLIKALGDWRSNTFMRYIEISMPKREHAAAMMAQLAHQLSLQ